MRLEELITEPPKLGHGLLAREAVEVADAPAPVDEVDGVLNGDERLGGRSRGDGRVVWGPRRRDGFWPGPRI